MKERNRAGGKAEAAAIPKGEAQHSGRQRLASSKLIAPYSQGELDGLCGLYTAVNALRLIAAGRGMPLSEDDMMKLFRHGAGFLDSHGKLSAAVRYGLRWRLWIKLVDELASKAGRMLGSHIELAQPFRALEERPKAIVLSAVSNALHERKPVLALLKGEEDHFTVISCLTEKRLRLFDSYGYHKIKLAACATEGEIGVTRHRIHLPSLLVVGP